MAGDGGTEGGEKERKQLQTERKERRDWERKGENGTGGEKVKAIKGRRVKEDMREQSLCRPNALQQEAQLSPSDRAMRLVSSNLTN